MNGSFEEETVVDQGLESISRFGCKPVMCYARQRDAATDRGGRSVRLFQYLLIPRAQPRSLLESLSSYPRRLC